jgi:putative cell wall-binding protein
VQSAPLLLVQPDSIPAETAAELRRLSPDRIVVLGGEAAVSAQVEAQLSTFVE